MALCLILVVWAFCLFVLIALAFFLFFFNMLQPSPGLLVPHSSQECGDWLAVFLLYRCYSIISLLQLSFIMCELCTPRVCNTLTELVTEKFWRRKYRGAVEWARA